MPLKRITTGFDAPLQTGAGELRVASSTVLFADRHNYTIGEVLWETVENINGTVSHLPDEAGVSMEIGSASGDKIVRQTFEYFNYTPSQVLKFEAGILYGSAVSGLRLRSGPFDADNGVFLEREGSTIRAVRRTSVSGSPVDNAVDQADWSVDKLDGSGESKKVLDLTKSQMSFIRYGWYGAGSVELGFLIDGERIIAHRFPSANTLAEPWAGSGNLPFRYEIENVSATGQTSELKSYGASVVSEGNQAQRIGFLFEAEGVVSAADGVRTHALSVRPKTTFAGITNRSEWSLESIEFLDTGLNPVRWEIGFGHTLDGSNWQDANASYSASEYNATDGILTQPLIVTKAGYTSADRNSATSVSVRTINILPLTLDAAGNQRDLGTIGVFLTAVGGAADVRVTMNWREIK